MYIFFWPLFQSARSQCEDEAEREEEGQDCGSCGWAEVTAIQVTAGHYTTFHIPGDCYRYPDRYHHHYNLYNFVN